MTLATVHLIAGARPNFMKVAPVYHELRRHAWCRVVLVHTGQHYDADMSDAFLQDLGMPAPDIYLGIGSGTHAQQTGAVMIAYERVCQEASPDWIIVVGDVNSTLACTLAAKKLHLPVAHLEAGLRSGDRTMPEEINRLLTDAIADLLWTPSRDADENLLREGVDPARIVRVGNIMIDSYEMLRTRIESDPTPTRFGVVGRTYGIVTLHRPSNVDSVTTLEPLVEQLIAISRSLPLVFAVHPRTRNRLDQFGLARRLDAASQITLSRPLGYIAFMSLVRNATVVITDSGGVQEETTYLDIPCLTLRDTTERPITITEGTNRLVRSEQLLSAVDEIVAGHCPTGKRPELWDGMSAPRVAKSLRVAIDSVAGSEGASRSGLSPTPST